MWISAVVYVEIHNVPISLDIYKYTRRLMYYIPFCPCIYDHRTKIFVGLKKRFLEVETHHIVFLLCYWICLCGCVNVHTIFSKIKSSFQFNKVLYKRQLENNIVSNSSFITAVNLFSEIRKSYCSRVHHSTYIRITIYHIVNIQIKVQPINCRHLHCSKVQSIFYY